MAIVRAAPVLLLVLLGVTHIQHGDSSTTSSPSMTREEEAIEHEATVAFYLMSKSTFAEKREIFRQTMAEAANSHCTAYYQACGLPQGWQNNQPFTITDVEISSDSDTEEKSALHVKYTVSLPRSLSGTVTAYILNKDAVYSSVSGARVEFYNAIGYSVIKAGAIKLSPVPDLTMNAVMITMGILVVLMGVGLLLGCHFYRKKESKNSGRKQHIDEYLKKHPKLPERERKVKPETAPPPTESYHQTSERKEPGRHYRADQKERNASRIREPEPSYTQTRNHQYSPDYSESSRQPFDNNQGYSQYDKDYREPYSQPRVQTMQVSSYDQPPSDRSARDLYYQPNDMPDRTSTLNPITPEEVRRQRKKEKKAKKRQRKADDEAAARYAMAGASPAVVGYENGSYDNSERYGQYPVAPSSGGLMNIPAAPIQQEEGPKSDYKYKDTGSEGSDSGLNSTSASRSVGSGYYRSTEV